MHDFDWLFENGNTTTLIMMLAQNENPLVLTTKSISMFINVVWEQYQSAILWRILVPILVYQAFFIFLSCKCLSDFLDREEGKDVSTYTHIQMYTVLGMCYLGSIGVTMYEFKQLIQEGSLSGYLSDFWNKIDATSLVINWIMIICSTICVINKEWTYTKYEMMVIGAISCFILWIKMFYWMRLFSMTAYYVKLIVQTI